MSAKSKKSARSSKPATPTAPLANQPPPVPPEVQIALLEQKQSYFKTKIDGLLLRNDQLTKQLEVSTTDQRDAMEHLRRELAKANQLVEQHQEQLQKYESQMGQAQAEAKKQQDEFQRAMNDEVQQWKSKYEKCRIELEQLQEFQDMKDTMEKKLTELKETLETTEREYKDNLHITERKLLQEKTLMKKDIIQRVNDIATQYRDSSMKEMSESTRRAIKENIVIKNQLQSMTKRLSELVVENEKYRKQNKQFYELNLELSQGQESLSKKYATNQKFLRILGQKLHQNDELLEEALGKYRADVRHLQVLGTDSKRAKLVLVELVRCVSELMILHANTTADSMVDKPMANDASRMASEIYELIMIKHDNVHVSERVEKLIGLARRWTSTIKRRRSSISSTGTLPQYTRQTVMPMVSEAHEDHGKAQDPVLV